VPVPVLVIALLAVCLGAAAAGVISGLFWLTWIAFAGILLVGATALSLVPPVLDDEPSPTPWAAELRSRAAGRPAAARHRHRQRGPLGRVA
jgi:hypothetical protein